MPRVVPSEVCRFIASISVIVLLTTHSPALAQQKTAPPSPNSQAQLEDRVKELETRLSAAEQKAASATMEKDYITRVQKQYETYYEKAFNTQVTTLSIIALFITIVFGLTHRTRRSSGIERRPAQGTRSGPDKTNRREGTGSEGEIGLPIPACPRTGCRCRRAKLRCQIALPLGSGDLQVQQTPATVRKRRWSSSRTKHLCCARAGG